jgi:hypothetical protein
MKVQKLKVGGGSGGGMGPSNGVSAAGAYQIQGNQVELLSQPPLPPTVPVPCVITVLAAGLEPEDGLVNVRGTAGVRITSGPVEDPPAYDPATQGVEIIVPPEHTITINCGGIPGVSPTILVSSEGIVIDAGEAPVEVASLTNINLSVADGVAEIDLAPEGVTITGPLVQIN